MEIDFLGLNSSKHTLPQRTLIDAASGGAEISLSLSTNSNQEILLFPEKKKKKTWEFLDCDNGSKLAPDYDPLVVVATPVYNGPGFFYQLNDVGARTHSELPTQSPAPTIFYPPPPVLFNQPQKVDGVAGISSTRLSRTGYTPTVAMARRATLARFLEKRSHRMKQGRGSPMIGKPPSVPISEASITKSNKRR